MAILGNEVMTIWDCSGYKKQMDQINKRGGDSLSGKVREESGEKGVQTLLEN